jgi:HD-GYP domain-containing protein (c-di-GMP phosphodiesterase class II)
MTEQESIFVTEPPGNSAAEKRALTTALEDAFGVPFTLWHPGHTAGDFASAAGLPPGSTGETTRTVQSARDTSQPQTAVTAAGVCLLAIPLDLPCTPGIVACGAIESASPDRLLRHARLFLRTQELEEENRRLTTASDSLTMQVSHDFEELMFLREAADHLRLLADSRDPLDMAEAIVPMLRETLNVETVVLIPFPPGPEHAVSQTDLPRIVRDGETAFDDDRCRELVLRIGDQARKRPFIQNEADTSELGRQFPGMRELLAVPVANGQGAGYLLAMNRVADSHGIKESWRFSEHRFGTVEASLLTSAASILATHFHNVELLMEGETLFTEIIKALVNAIEARDPYTCGHSERVAQFCRRLGQECGLETEACENLHLAGLLHDVGKIAISDTVLQKPGNLTDEEFTELKKHPGQGLAILKDLSHLRHVLPGVVHHHERFDGKGYPYGLQGESIPVEGRIMSICDAYDAMTSNRPYRQAMAQEKAEAILRDGAGTQWDPELIEKFLAITPDIIRIRDAHQPDALS